MGRQETGFRPGFEPFLKAAKDAIATGDPPGIVALVWRNGEFFDTALGVRVVEENLPMRRDTIFRIASMTKPITSVLMMMLVEDGKLRLEDPVIKWAPELANRRVLKDPKGPLDDTFPAPREITIEDPAILAKPFTMKRVSDLAPTEDIYEFICPENNRDVVHLVGK